MTQKIGVFGASGYSGQELVRLLAGHPEAELAFATGSAAELLDHEAGLERPADAYLLALPHGVSAGYAKTLRSRFPAAPVIDLSGDLRLATPQEYERWYGQPHVAPELLGEVPYGLTEVHRDQVAGAKLIANPGCYATSVLLPLVPLLADGVIADSDIIVDAKSGASGAGRSPKAQLLYCEVAENLSAYSPGRVHRHVAEMEQELGRHGPGIPQLTFSPHLLPIKRGILSAIYVKTAAEPEALRECLGGFYAKSPFVKVTPADAPPPPLCDVVFTNECRISIHTAAAGRCVIFSAIDNLLKGAAGQAVQNLNLTMGWPETLGLPGGTS